MSSAGALKRNNKLGDKEEVAKLMESSQIAQKLEDWERKKKEQQERVQTQRTVRRPVLVAREMCIAHIRYLCKGEPQNTAGAGHCVDAGPDCGALWQSSAARRC